MTSTLKWAKICPLWRGSLQAFEEYLMLPSKMLQDYYKLQEKLQRQQEEIREYLKSFYTFSTLTKQKATNDKDGEKEEEDR